ncbi:MAG: hypothetical protein Q9222_002480 [Ikaeria aurantiellina]
MPHPPSRSNSLANFAAHRLHSLSAADAQTTTSFPANNNKNTGSLYLYALSFVEKLQNRLRPSLFRLFLQILADYTPGSDLRRTREELAQVFERAGERELLDEFLEGFMLGWREDGRL